MPKISVIVPIYKTEKYLNNCVESIVNQTYTDIEIILVDDGSGDGTFAICERLAKGKDNVHLFAAEHGGVSKARNFGVSQAHGDYVLFIDCDDTWKNELLESIDSLLEEKSELVLFGMGHDYYLSNDSFQYHEANLGDSGLVKKIETDKNIDKLFSAYNMSSPCNKVYKRKIIEKNALAFSEKCVYLEDLKFNFDYLQHVSSIKVLHQDLYHYRLFTDKKQMLKRNFGEPFVNADELFCSCIGYLNSRNTSLETKPVLNGILITAYINEFLARTHGSSKKTARQVLLSLNHNSNFQELLKISHGKFFKLYKVLNKLGFNDLQIKLLKRRFN